MSENNFYFDSVRTVSITFDERKLRYLLAKKIMNCVIAEQAIIFGGAVSAFIIKRYFTNMFYRRNDPDTHELFGNPNFDIETVDRLIIPNDIDIYCYTETIYSSILEKIKKIENGITTQTTKTIKPYYLGKHLIHKRVIVTKKLFGDIKVSINLDFLVCVHHTLRTQEPPFNRLDFLSNSLIYSRDGSPKGNIRFSENTGTMIDELDEFDKAMLFTEVCKQIISRKTYMITDYINKNSMDEIHIRERKIYINRLVAKLDPVNMRPWKIVNSPISVHKSNDDTRDTVCVVCQEELGDDVHYVEFNQTRNKLHQSCFNSYIDKHLDDRITVKDLMNTEQNFWNHPSDEIVDELRNFPAIQFD